ncbi:MAG: 50S ribosomal protein L18 [Candidatus Margulisiibacteriota bacterium]
MGKIKIRKRKIFGTTERPRLSVFRSAKNISAQIIDDTVGRTLVCASTVEKGLVKKEGKGKTAVASAIGKIIAERALAKNITKVVFDRGRFKYHGRVKALAEGAREGGLQF